jgi:hypothetical protein
MTSSQKKGAYAPFVLHYLLNYFFRVSHFAVSHFAVSHATLSIFIAVLSTVVADSPLGATLQADRNATTAAKVTNFFILNFVVFCVSFYS